MIDIDRNARTIFCDALDLTSAEERNAYLTDACGHNSELRKRVEDLLGAHDDAGKFLGNHSLDDSCSQNQALAEHPGDLIGPYKLLEQLGEGGFGVVFLAEQDKPVRRRVALKVVKPGMDTREVIARFEAERQALALMDHSNIAKVFDAGVTENGRPYFVMELVQGVPITEYCDQCQLTMRERLELFVTVCQAVQHAHQKGIIHRDLKPTNVLVAMQDGKATPKIIDFGVAKAIGEQSLTERTLTTAFAQMIGSPLYMSPEQAELSPLGVDTRSDIYSLGVLLYELLTGATPFDKDRLHAASYDELRRIIREEEPPRPSARISTLKADLATTVAESRRTDARRLQQTIRGELDWIVMKCLDKDRNRRYETPNSLARDIERFLHDEPVQACPPSAAYRLRKYARRNKVVLAFMGLLVAGLIYLVYSRAALEGERYAKTTALARAEAISNLLQQLLASSNPDEVKGAQYTVRELLDDFSAGLGDQLAGQPEVESAVRSVIGKSYWRLGVTDRAELHLKKAIDLRRKTFGDSDERVADSLVDYAWNLSEQGRFDDAERCVRDALSIFRQQGSDSRRTMRGLWSLQQFLIRQGRLADAEEVAGDALALAGDEQDSDYLEVPNILHGLAEANLTEGRHQEAEKLASRAVAAHRRLHSDHHPETAWALNVLGRAFAAQQKYDLAEPPLREALDIFREYYTQDHHSIQGVILSLKAILEAQGDREGLETLAREEAEQSNQSDGPGYHVLLASLLLTNNPTASQQDEARRLVRRALKEYGQVAVVDSDDLDRRLMAAEGFVEVVKLGAGRPDFADEVDEAHRQLDAEILRLFNTFPNSPDTVIGCSYLACLLSAAQWPQEAVDLLRLAAASAERLREPSSYASATCSLAIARLRLGDEAGYREACAKLTQLAPRIADDQLRLNCIRVPTLGVQADIDPQVLVKLAEEFAANNSLNTRFVDLQVLGAAHFRAGQYETASRHLEQSIAAYPSDPPTGIGTVLMPQLLLAMTKWQQGKHDAARTLLFEIEPAIDEWLRSPTIPWDHRTALEIRRREAVALIKRDQAQEAADVEGRTRNEVKQVQ
jgi:serine/threonine protein kinase